LALFDLPLEQLQTYLPDRDEPDDFNVFWDRTLQEARQHPLDARFDPVDYGLRTVETFDVTFRGYGGDAIKGWLLLPRERSERLPCVVEYIGYGGGRGFPTEWLVYASAGYAHLVMDTRGQGSAWRKGDTPDPEGTGASYPGFMTRGILDPEGYYYRRLITDAVRAVEAARAFDGVDPARVAITGGSQGGGLALAVGGLLPDVAAVLADVPFLCHFRRAVTLTDSAPYSEIAAFCRVHRGEVERVFRTLGYFDGMHFAARARARALVSVALMDTVCPPSTVYAAHNHYAGPKELRVYLFNGHEGGEEFQTLQKLTFLRALWSG